MVEVKKISIAGMHCDGDLLWIAAPDERLVATHKPTTGETAERFTYTQEIWDVCPSQDGLWLVTGGGKLGRQLVLWSLKDAKEIRKFDCPDGAGAGMTLFDGKLWVTHRHNRKLFCLDPKSGKTNWIIRTEREAFSPVAYKGEFWFVESDPGPLGHWSETKQGKYFFSRYDPARERIMERIAVPFVPRCMAFDGERFWYSEQGKKGFCSAKKNFG
jgi:streptogramin lyase